VGNSPKPPPERVSLTLPAINSATEIWLVVAGDDKAGAVGLALAGAGPVQVPAAGPKGRQETLWMLDQAAASQLPDSLLAGGETF
jgi:6-phosphogluconolactonase